MEIEKEQNSKINASTLLTSNPIDEESNEMELDEIVVVVDVDDEVKRRLPMWFGDPRKDVLRAEDWFESVQRAKHQFEWNDEVTMKHIVNALQEESLLWFLDLVKFFIYIMI
jgi:hypothetical protein